MGIELLPSSFIRRIREQLGEEADSFLASYEQPRTQGLRLNQLKAADAAEPVQAILRQFRLTPVPWCETGYYYDETARPGKHPYHAAGLYYIQEPSAMSAVELLDPQPGETILDLAAAPGGKTSHIASKLAGTGLLVANEIHPERARILAENVERMGIANAVVTSAAPDELSRRFAGCFDRIMLDAPCSGEGMFRKDPGAIQEWSPAHVELCAARQWDIVQEACKMLKPGGVLAYSTCTFNEAENEGIVNRILGERPEMQLRETTRLWPHRERGEGHFVAILVKSGDEDGSGHISPKHEGKRAGKPGKGSKPAPQRQAEGVFQLWAEQDLPGLALPPGRPLLFGDELYWLPAGQDWDFTESQLQGLKIPRAGLHLAHLKKNRIEPAHALAMASKPEQAARSLDLPPDSREVFAYMRGEALPVRPECKGWTLVTTDGLPLGWGKASGGQLKNHLPKGLRQMK